MSLSEQDREVLLQEIQQIQRTLQATDRDFGSYNSSDEEQDDLEDGSEVCTWNNLSEEPYRVKPVDNLYYVDIEEEDEIENGFSAGVDDTSTSNTLDERCLQDPTNIITEANRLLTANNDESTFNILSQTKRSSEELSNDGNTFTKSSLSLKLKNRLERDSQFTGSVFSKNTKSEASTPTSFDDGVSSLDGSLPASLNSIPDKNKDQISMTNLYVERIFRDYRKNKHKTAPSISMRGLKYDNVNLKCSANLSTLENLLQVNRRYQEILQNELKKVGVAIARNRRAQDELMATVEEKSTTYCSLAKACIGRFGKPYFKDADGLGPPDNEDTKAKKVDTKVIPFIKGSRPWKSSETKLLEEGVYNNNLEKRLEPFVQKLKHFDLKYKERLMKGERNLDKKARLKISKEMSEIKELPCEELLKDSVEVDFFKISKNWLPTRDEFECRIQWCNVVHPTINQKKFTKEEDSRIIKLAKKYQNHSWELIAKELATNRTPVQCLQRFQRTLNKDMIKNNWDEEDDEHLKKAIRSHGSNWVGIADLFGDRTADQCMNRWEKTLNPAIKRGKWSTEEDQLLFVAVDKYGKGDWKNIKTDVPGRTDAQCRERYVSSLDPTINWEPLTQQEDEKLLELVQKYGKGKWAKIAKEMPGRRDHQIWRRYKQIEADDYHEYRRGVLWKKRSVLNYFLHRKTETRDYDLQDLEVNYSPSLTHFEARKLERTKEELLRKGYTEEESTKKLARLHFDGYFSQPQYIRPQKQNSIGKTTTSKKGESLKYTPKKASKQLISEVKKTIANTENPEVDLPLVQHMDVSKIVRKPVKILQNQLAEGGKVAIKFEKESEEELYIASKVVMKYYKAKKLSYADAKKQLETYLVMLEEQGKCEDDIDKTRNNINKLISSLEILNGKRERREQNIMIRQNQLNITRDSTNEIYTENETNMASPDNHATWNAEGALGSKKRKRATPRRFVDSQDVDNEQVTSEPKQTDLSDQLKTFTLLLQALHVDTAAVMKSLPQNTNVSDESDEVFSMDKLFPTCYPLSPNEASLRGFRTLLLHRRTLGAIVNETYPSRKTRDLSYQNSKTYDALRKRFRSLFMWPAFLATFLPKFITPQVEVKQKFLINPNRSLLATTVNRKRSLQPHEPNVHDTPQQTKPEVKQLRISPRKVTSIDDKVGKYIKERARSNKIVT